MARRSVLTLAGSAFSGGPTWYVDAAYPCCSGSGSPAALSGTIPPSVARLSVWLQALQRGPAIGDVLHWTNLEQVSVHP